MYMIKITHSSTCTYRFDTHRTELSIKYEVMICAMKHASTDHILHMYAPSVISSNLYVYCVHDCIYNALQKTDRNSANFTYRY